MPVRTVLLFTLLATLVACRPERPTGKPPEPVVTAKPESTRDTVVARIADREITLGELDDRLNSLPVFVRMRYQGADRRREFLDAYVEYVVLGLAAEEAGYGKDPVVTEALKADMAERFLRDRVDLRLKTTDIPEDRVRAWYDAHVHEFRRPEQIRVSHLRVPDRATAEKLAFRARKRIEKTGGDPREVFAEVIKAAGAGGELGWFPRNDSSDGPEVVPEIAAAARELKDPFDVGAPVLASGGFHVLFLAERRPASDLSFDQAKARVVTTLMEAEREARRAALVAELRGRAAVTIDEEAVRRVAAASKETP